MSNNPHFLWPDAQITLSSFNFFTAVSEVELALQGMYPGVEPVLFSSARAGISAVLELLPVGRADGVWCAPYSSHCVLEAVSRTATPSSLIEQCNTAIIYHQWGFIHHVSGAGIVIEDSADSLLMPGQILFPNNGAFQLVSLPKIYGCGGGGVVFCKGRAEAEKLRTIRDNRLVSTSTQFLLKWAAGFSRLALEYWGGAESAAGKPASVICSGILQSLKKTAVLVREKQEKLAMVKPYAPAWLKFPEDRLPCAVPVEFEKYCGPALPFTKRRITALHFNASQNANDSRQVKVWPIPIHQGISVQELECVLKSFHA